MCCRGEAVPHISEEYASLLGKFWDVPQHRFTRGSQRLTEIDYLCDGGVVDKGERPRSLYVAKRAGSAAALPLREADVSTRLRKKILVPNEVIVTPENRFEMNGVSDDKIARLHLSGINVGFALGFNRVGAEVGYQRVDRHGRGGHVARFVVAVRSFKLSVQPDQLDRSEWWSRVGPEQLSVSHFSNADLFGNSVVLGVAFGGVMMLEMDQTNYAEFVDGVEGAVGVGVGVGEIDTHLRLSKKAHSGQQRFECRVKVYGGRRPEKDLLNLNAQEILKLIRKYVMNLESCPEDAVPLKLFVSEFRALFPLLAEDAFGGGGTGSGDGSSRVGDGDEGGNADEDDAAARSAAAPKAEALPPPPPPPPPPAAPGPPEPAAAATLAQREPSVSLLPAATGAVVHDRRSQDVPMEAAPVDAPHVDESDALVKREEVGEGEDGAEDPKEDEVTEAQRDDALAAVALLRVFMPRHTQSDTMDALVPVVEPGATLSLFGVGDWLNCVVALFSRSNCVATLDLSAIDAADWELIVAAAVLEGSAYTGHLRVVNVKDNSEIGARGLHALVAALSAIAGRHHAHAPPTVMWEATGATHKELVQIANEFANVLLIPKPHK